ncbi:hypothetical protein E2C01_030060 [Portunus trituberculatus]|uniref:Uncharacterized protein n=1 Tax=Portunus trituberculatus TaxID=210409 RepID=A0A5B7ETQ2_PORTR|nr:hypothetical protein [Portunus trituberculatus]
MKLVLEVVGRQELTIQRPDSPAIVGLLYYHDAFTENANYQHLYLATAATSGNGSAMHRVHTHCVLLTPSLSG